MTNNAVVERALEALRALNRREQKCVSSLAVTIPAQALEPTGGSAQTETACFHCQGVGSCACISCGQYRAWMVRMSGECQECKALAKRAEAIQ